MSKSWYRHSHDIEFKDGHKEKEYQLVFETTDITLAKRVEIFFQSIMDNKELEPKEREWIPVSERLPEEGARVLISLKLKRTKKVVRSATYYGECCFHSDTGDFWDTQEDVELLAWMPLPEP